MYAYPLLLKIFVKTIRSLLIYNRYVGDMTYFKICFYVKHKFMNTGDQNKYSLKNR